VIILFLDKNDLFTQRERKQELRALERSKEYYTKEINKLQKQYEALRTDPAALEKLAREKFLMKRDNEELFIISEKHE
jgi:cell division protein DivIC